MLRSVQELLPTPALLNRDAYIRGDIGGKFPGDRVKIGGTTGGPNQRGDFEIVTRTDRDIAAGERASGKDPKPAYVALHLAATFTDFVRYAKKAELARVAAAFPAPAAPVPADALVAAPVVEQALAEAPVQPQPPQAPPANIGFGYAAAAAPQQHVPVVVDDAPDIAFR